jgi:CheY-like chemotaxis protein
MSKKILYVEDNPINVSLVRRILKAGDYELLVSPDGPSGVSGAKQFQPDLILVDITLPGIDGLEVTRRLKMAPQTSAIPIIALTAHNMDGDRQRCLDAGCDGYVVKPIIPTELLNVIARFLAESGKPAAAH